jgi:hypothetical protein
MGLEQTAKLRWEGGTAEVKALLKSRELIVRGGVRRRFALAEMTAVAATGDTLSFAIAGEPFSLVVGVPAAQRWAKKIQAPAPSLADKLGIGPDVKALAIGPIEEDSALCAALPRSRIAGADEARLSVAIVDGEADLQEALSQHAALPHGAFIWIVHGKGPSAPFGEAAVRTFMRAAGYMDNKVCAVSSLRSATRYARR